MLWNGRSDCAAIMQQGMVPELVTDEAEARLDIISNDRLKFKRAGWDDRFLAKPI